MCHAPALQHGPYVTCSHPDEIVEYIDTMYPVLSLKSDDCKSNNAASNLFRAFAFFIKKINDDSKVIYEIASIIIVKGVFIEEIFFTE